MFRITNLETANEKKGALYYLGLILEKMSTLVEVLILIFFWSLIIMSSGEMGGFSREEMIAYLIFGNIIGSISSFFLYRTISKDINSRDSRMLVYKPLRYIIRVVIKGFLTNLLPFFITISLNIALLYFFLEELPINKNPQVLCILFIMICLAFIFELFLAYLMRMYVFWKIEKINYFKMIMRLKKILAGNYFPLNILPMIAFQSLLFLPFAYLFYVPTQLYLGKINNAQGIMGIFIQLCWIVILYITIKLSWNKKKKELKA